jgi:hypothetical protein
LWNIDFATSEWFMKYFTLLVMVLVSCKQHFAKPSPPPLVMAAKPVMPKVLPDYNNTKANIKALKKELLLQYRQQKISLQKVEEAFIAVMADSIFPHWYGTAWDFNGTTQIPGKGAIACGYFVTTTLEHGGVKLDRVRLGQSASQKIINTLITKNSKKVFSDAPAGKFLGYIKAQGRGLYIVGLDCHVGFLYNDGNDIFFIHSKWANPRAVFKEGAVASGILKASRYKYVGKLSSDELFLQRWIGYTQ